MMKKRWERGFNTVGIAIVLWFKGSKFDLTSRTSYIPFISHLPSTLFVHRGKKHEESVPRGWKIAPSKEMSDSITSFKQFMYFFSLNMLLNLSFMSKKKFMIMRVYFLIGWFISHLNQLGHCVLDIRCVDWKKKNFKTFLLDDIWFE